jgi:prepilin-type processing-associated H-X9-DG protein
MTGEQRNFTWIALLLPFIEQAPLHGQINFGQPALNQTLSNGQPLREVVLKNLLCPSDTPFKTLPQGFGYTTYAGNAGWDGHRRSYGDEFRAGIFSLLDPVSIGDVKDGTSNVFLVGEVGNRGFCCWNAGGATTIWRAGGGAGRMRIGSTEPVFRSVLVAPSPWVNTHAWIDVAGGPLLRADGQAGAAWGNWSAPYAFHPTFHGAYPMGGEWPGSGSTHPGGAQYGFCDASVKFISENISTGTLDSNGNADNYGRFGNIWTGLHFRQGHPDKTIVTLP